jgi:3-oxoacyl-[acyl-carrier protein] reductase
MELKDRVALVTGAGVGTGRAIALDLARHGCHVVINYSSSRDEAEKTTLEARELGVKALCVKADVGRDEEVRSMVATALEQLDRLDVLVNNAGATSFIPHGDLEAVKESDWERILGVNLKGAFYCVRAAAPSLREANGAVVNVSSVAGVAAIGSSIPYCASKAALNNMTVALARALAPEIRVNAVAPGFIDTRWWQDREGYDAIKELAAARSPLKRVCQAEDVSAVVLGLLAADLVTGQVVVVDGGMTIAG